LPTISNLAFAALAAGVVGATVIDLRTRRIPNLLTATMAAVGIGIAAAGLNVVSVWAAALGVIVGLALMLPGHVLGATGAGDVKLMAAIGSLLGPLLVFKAVLFTLVAGGVLAVLVALKRKRLSMTLATTARMMAAPSEAHNEIAMAPPSSRFAYAPAIALGSIIAALIG
jgi:prepilin peptidase CpaA